MKLENLNDAFVFLRGDGSQSLPVIDCMNAYALGKGELEKHFDSHLWLDASEDGAGDMSPFSSVEAQQYYMELARIEEFLVANSLIYQD